MNYEENPKSYNEEMHTAEHILNQTMDRMFKTGRAYSAHIEKKKSKCDYHFSRNLTEDERIALEEAVNHIIRENMPVTEHFLAREEAEEAFKLDKLPDSAGDTIRIIRVGDYDACPCSGPHVDATEEIGEFRIVSSDHSDGRLRVRFKLKRPA